MARLFSAVSVGDAVPAAALRLIVIADKKLLIACGYLAEGIHVALDPLLIKVLEPRHLEAKDLLRGTAGGIPLAHVVIVEGNARGLAYGAKRKYKNGIPTKEGIEAYKRSEKNLRYQEL